MRKPSAWIMSAVALLIGGSPAPAQSAREIVENAIKAHGGADTIRKYPAAKSTGKGKINIMGLEVMMESETVYQLPDLGRNVLKLDVGGNKVTVVQVMNGDKIRVTANEMPAPLSDAQRGEVKEAFYLQSVQNLVPLSDDKRFELSVIEKADKVNGREVDGIVVKSKGRKDVSLFFDKKTHELLKMERLGLNEVEKEVKQELFFLEHKKFDGILRPVKSELHMDGKIFMTAEVVEYKHLEKADKKEFDVSD